MSSPAHKPLSDAAFEYIERGVSILPINPHSKKPLVRWKEFQDRLPTEEDIAHWQQLCAKEGIAPEDVKLAAVTGRISGFVIVDCDRPEAVEYCKAAGVWSPIRVRTKHGIHLYFRHAGDREYRPRVGSNSRGVDWPKFDGLDFRGDGSYALIPPSTNYVWEVEEGFAIDDMDDWPVWRGWPATEIEPEEQLDFSRIDLAGVAVKDGISVWEATRAYVAERFPSTGLIPTGQGNGRNQRVLAYASEQILYGHWGDALDERVKAFMDSFFVERLPEAEWTATCRSVEQMERTNHPERFAADGSYIPPLSRPTGEAQDQKSKPDQEPIDWSRSGLIDYGKLPSYLLNRPPREFFLRPIIWNKSVTMVHGYAGQGKSTFVQLLMHALMTETRVMEVGPFSIDNRPRRVLVLNYEEDDYTHHDRFVLNSQIIGPLRKGSFISYSPGVVEHSMPMPLNDEAGRALLTRMLKFIQPDILVIDNIRLAFPSLEENDAKSWVPVNEMCLALRNAGLTVILVHHANKGGDFSGSSNAITVLNTAISVSQLYDSEDLANRLRGRYDKLGKRQEVLNYLPNQGQDWYLNFLMEVSFSKARGFNDDYDHYYHLGLATYQPTGGQRLVCIPSTRQRAMEMAFGQNASAYRISMSKDIGKSRSVIERWIEEEKERRR